jgi:hypothetical protein
MNIKSLLARPFSGYIARQIKKGIDTALSDQESILKMLITEGKKTVFGKDHGLSDVKTYADFCKSVPIRDYEALKPYIEQIKEGKHNILWKGKPIYFAKTSGTTSGVKYIPITKDSIPNHINSARNALACYMSESGNYSFPGGKLIFLSGSPVLERVADIPTGRLSGIVNHHIPQYLRTNQLPSYETNCIDDWELKLDKIVAETHNQNMTLISGIPPWMQMYFDRLTQKSGKKVGTMFPNFNVLVHGGVNFEPYKQRLFESIGREVDTIETFPASEGFFAFQDSQKEQGLLLNTNSGIFFEFVPANEIFNENPSRFQLSEVKTGINYALIVNSNAGLWGYNIGDTVRFLSTNPYRLVVTGRTKQFISAFGEHVIAEEVEAAITEAAKLCGVGVAEFSVAPYIAAKEGQSFHEWYVEFEQVPEDITGFAHAIDDLLRQKNVYYDDLIRGNILKKLQIVPVCPGGFVDYLKSVGKLGGQNKMPRLSNDRKVVEGLAAFTMK